MRLADFRALIDRLKAQVPAQYLDGIVEITVSPQALPHPVRAEIYTLGECIPLEWSGTGADLQSRVVLYHGSFSALSRLSGAGEFDWREEAWETLTHELRHHLEWRANVEALEKYDWASEQNFARHDGERFDPAFYRDGERLAEGVYKVDDDVFVELDRPRGVRPLEVTWHGRRYRAELPPDLDRPAFVRLDGLDEPPPGDVHAVLRSRPAWRALLGRQAPAQLAVTVQAVDPAHG
jgi:hypothetical protein